MLSSTSSSDPTSSQPDRSRTDFFRDRTRRALGLGILLLALGETIPKPERQRVGLDGFQITQLWGEGPAFRSHTIGNRKAATWRKLDWSHCADVVLAGDSRTNVSLSPEAMRDVLKGSRVYNFGFSAAGYSDEYLDAVEQVIDPTSTRPTIVLGITPRSLTPEASQENDFRVYREKRRHRGMLSLEAGGWELFEPVTVEDLRFFLGLLPREKGTSEIEFTPLGWNACRVNELAPKGTLPEYEKHFRRSQVTAENTSRVLGRVTAWTKQGLRVYGIRPPTTVDMVQLEDSKSGFEEETFAAAFRAAGGIWLEAPPGDYASYDGSHLTRASAEALSRAVAGRIRSIETARASNGSTDDRR